MCWVTEDMILKRYDVWAGVQLIKIPILGKSNCIRSELFTYVNVLVKLFAQNKFSLFFVIVIDQKHT